MGEKWEVDIGFERALVMAAGGEREPSHFEAGILGAARDGQIGGGPAEVLRNRDYPGLFKLLFAEKALQVEVSDVLPFSEDREILPEILLKFVPSPVQVN